MVEIPVSVSFATNGRGAPSPDTQVAPQPTVAWFCVRSQPKHEHIAAAHLQREAALEVYLPRIRFKRATRSGAYWVTEAMFPGYLFARFDLRESLRWVQSCAGVSGVVHFGQRWPTMPEAAIQELRATLGEQTVHEVHADFQPGDRVLITGGTFHGLEALVSKLLSGRERVAILLEFLGQQTTVEVSVAALLPAVEQRKLIFDGEARATDS